MTAALLLSTHIGMSGLNSVHPTLEFKDTAMVYLNSFNVPSFALYKRLNSGNYNLRLGATTGYKREMTYKGNRYENHFATDQGIGLFIVPSYEGKYIVTVMGNAVAIGLKGEF